VAIGVGDEATEEDAVGVGDDVDEVAVDGTWARSAYRRATPATMIRRTAARAARLRRVVTSTDPIRVGALLAKRSVRPPDASTICLASHSHIARSAT
jgi:hypothetical protein